MLNSIINFFKGLVGIDTCCGEGRDTCSSDSSDTVYGGGGSDAYKGEPLDLSDVTEKCVVSGVCAKSSDELLAMTNAELHQLAADKSIPVLKKDTKSILVGKILQNI